MERVSALFYEKVISQASPHASIATAMPCSTLMSSQTSCYRFGARDLDRLRPRDLPPLGADPDS
jgi:hypothetical protein